MRTLFCGALIGLAIGVTITLDAPQQHSGQKAINPGKQKISAINWDLASAFNSSEPFTGNLGPSLIKRLKRIRNGSILIKFYEPDALIPTNDLFDAVSSGILDTALSSSQLWSHKSPTFELFSSAPFGPDIVSYMTWFREHGG